MSAGYEIHNSNKSGINTKESYIIVRGRTSYLRIIGEHPTYLMMTATASEDRSQFTVCADGNRLVSAARQFAAEMNQTPTPKKDISGRDYIFIGEITVGENFEEFNKALNQALDRFFEIFDGFGQSEPEKLNDMQEIYEVLAVDDSGDDVYLGDGVWLSSDGTPPDRGR